MKLIRYITLFTLVLILCILEVNAQNYSIYRGLPFVRNYSPEEYKAHESNYDLVQSSDGIMYFANFAGVLQFDGSTWNKVPTLSGMRVMSVCIDKNNRIYVGGLQDFGYLTTDEFGRTNFKSLTVKQNVNDAPELILKVLIDRNNVLFISENRIYIYDGERIKTQTLESKITSAFEVGGTVYFFFDPKITGTKYSGLYKYQNEKFIKVNTLNGLILFDVKFIIPSSDENELILGSENQGLFLMKDNQIREFNCPANELLKLNRISCGIRTNSSVFAVGTSTGGIVLVNKYGSITQIIDQSSRLLDESISSLYLDNNQSLWALTKNGISKIEINWPLSYIDNKTSGLSGKVQDIEFYRNKLFCATDEGLYFISNSTIANYGQLNAACLSLLKISDILVVASSRGLYQLNGDALSKTNDNNFSFCLTNSISKPSVFYVGQNGLMSVYQVVNNSIDLLKTVGKLPGEVLKIEEDKFGNIFLEVSPGRIFIIKNGTENVKEIGGSDDFLTLHLNSINGEIFFSSERGLYTCSLSDISIVPFKLCSVDSLSQKLWIHDLFEISESLNLITNGEQKGLAFFHNREKGFEVNQTPYLPVASFTVQSVWVNHKNAQIIAGGKDGLLISDYKELIDYNSKFKTILTEIAIINNDSLLKLGTDQVLPIDYSDNSIRFKYSIPVFPATGFVEYRYFLDGFDKDTSSWITQNEKEYTNLPSGTYEFIVEARNEFGKTAEKSTFKFKIRTPLYRQWWAILIYTLLLAAIIRLFIVWRMRASRKEKERLEELVRERTEEIELSKKKIEEQRDIAYRHRKEILDSISYAQKIQQAVLPSPQYADDILLEHFIFYRPRDIVSGDFYWMKKLNNYVAVVAADCTGHGVPGAFMSMLGSSFLNEIVTRRSLDNAAQILNRLRSKVKKSLHQEGKEGEQKDGMDIALLIIDNETLELQYAGAYNPLYIIRPKTGVNLLDENLDTESRFELIHLKADRQPIGIHLAEREFTNHQFQLKSGDSLYSFSDGYVDQFGGETGEKFKVKRFKDLLMSVQGKPMREQKQILEQAFIKWKRDLAQIDDVLVMGIKV